MIRKRVVIVLGIVALLTVTSAAQKPGPPKLEPAPPTDSQKQLIREGIALHDKGDYDGAISRYEAVLRENPNNVQALHEMSFSYFAKKDYQKSIEVGYKAAVWLSMIQRHIERLDQMRPRVLLGQFAGARRLGPRRSLPVRV